MEKSFLFRRQFHAPSPEAKGLLPVALQTAAAFPEDGWQLQRSPCHSLQVAPSVTALASHSEDSIVIPMSP